MAGELQQALAVRDRELAAIVDRGRLVSECEVHIKRCRLLALLGRLHEEDVTEARQAASRLRKPDVYLAELEQAAAGK